MRAFFKKVYILVKLLTRVRCIYKCRSYLYLLLAPRPNSPQQHTHPAWRTVNKFHDMAIKLIKTTLCRWSRDACFVHI